MVQLFNGIDKDKLPQLLECINARTVKYKKDEIIIEEGNHTTEFGVVLSGGAQSIKWDMSGRVIILTFIEEGSLIGVMVAARECHISPVSVQATTDTEIMLIPFKNILSQCKRGCIGHEQLLRNYINIVAEKGIELHERIDCLLEPTVRDKILKFLRKTAKEKGQTTFTIQMDRNQMAQYLNIDRTALSRELSKMQKDHLITYNKNCFVLLKK